MISRPGLFRRLVPVLLGLIPLTATAQNDESPIDRHALVSRHDVRVDHVDPEAALSVGNGDFAFTVDVTGLQSFEELYYREGLPLETLCRWAWHSFPNPEGLQLADAMKRYPFHGRMVPYAALQESPAGAYYRENPHPIPLGQISLLLDGQVVQPEDLGGITQVLDLWTGVVKSHYTLRGQPVSVETVAHGSESAVAVRLSSPLIASGALQVRLRFPYSYQVSIKNKPPFVWDKPDQHRTEIVQRGERSALLRRTIDESTYFLHLSWEGEGNLREVARHELRLDGTGASELAFTATFFPEARATGAGSFDVVKSSSERAWNDYWTKGGVVDLSGSTDPRAPELERRIVLSQYLMRVNYASAMPPAESGLTHLSWYGKHNSEMYFWHAAQFYQWGHVDLLEKGLAWYRKILPVAKRDAAAQGFLGARWPKMAGPDGRQSPGTINPFIIWNEPNPIYLSELVYRARPTRETLEKYRDIVLESARFLESFAFFDEATGRYVLGPPIKNVSERSGENNTQNPTFELAYWYYGLQLAQEWRARLGLAANPRWDDILHRLSRLPEKDGLYLEIETFPEMYQRRGGLPTSMLLALGFLPRTGMVDLETMRRTFHEVNRRARNGLRRWVSWSIGQGASTAARLNEPETAVSIVTNPAAVFMPSGHVRRPAEPENCPAFLPVNSALLSAVGLMAAGWDDAPPHHAPGFPHDGSWHVRWEGLNPMP